jgi:hypothetical protein
MERNRRGEHESLCARSRARLRHDGRVGHDAVRDTLSWRVSGMTSERPVSER